MQALRKKRHALGFSLIELLSVVALISILAVATIPAVSNFASSSRRTKYLNDLSSVFESARQYAVSKNTYVWVGFSADASNGTPLYACVMASRNGLAQGYGSEDAWNSQVIDMANNEAFTPVSRVITLGDFKLNSADSLASTAQFRVQAGQRDIQLTRSVQFSPSGEAKISGATQGNIAFETAAIQGQMKDVKDTFVLNGPTGFLQFDSGN